LLSIVKPTKISEAIRIAGSLVFILLFFILTAVLVKVDMDPDVFFSGSLFGLVGLLPQKYSAVFMSGQGLAGTFAAVAMLVFTAMAEGTSVETEKLNGHIDGSVTDVAAETRRQVEDKVETSPSRTKQADNSPDKASVTEVFKKVRVMAFCVAFVFTVTLSVFPAITVDVKTSFPGKWGRSEHH
ncbi:hypothetical protein XENOCAPTIV_011658, partial [Xenoophorus captivus]